MSKVFSRLKTLSDFIIKDAEQGYILDRCKDMAEVRKSEYYDNDDIVIVEVPRQQKYIEQKKPSKNLKKFESKATEDIDKQIEKLRFEKEFWEEESVKDSDHLKEAKKNIRRIENELKALKREKLTKK